MVTYAEIQQARIAFDGAIRETPSRYSGALSKLLNANVQLKLENLQHTGSFKCRGALRRLLTLSEAERDRGVVAASAGNHAQGVAYHATELGIPSTIVMPVGTPLNKISRTSGYGAQVVLEGENYDAAYLFAQKQARAENKVLIHPFDDEHVIAGQGTIALEILEQVPDVETVIVPVGGGGLMAGIAVGMKAMKPDIRMIGVEPTVLPSMQAAIAAGGPCTIAAETSLADGIAVRRVGDLTYEICAEMVDEWVSVDDDDIARAILYLLENEKTLAEGAGAAAVAALLSGAIAPNGQNTVALVCGGNIDVNVLNRIIERGLVESGRVARLEIRMVDRPGALAALLERVARLRANVLEVHHERAFYPGSLRGVWVSIKVETRGRDHVTELRTLLSQNGYVVKQVD